jgi:branched-subunit amino acid aminotransferase/4-amino-4-deoxychorismate lyase
MANVGFFDDTGVIWPDAPMLDGITKQLLKRYGPEHGMTTRDRPMRVSDVQAMVGAFISSARGMGRVTAIDNLAIDTPEDRVDALRDVYAAVPWDEI